MLGLNESGRLTDAKHMDALVDGIVHLFEFYFVQKDNNRRGNLLGKALFEGCLFGKSTGIEVGFAIVKTVTTHTFTDRRLLKAIDTSSQGGLNDTAL